MEAEIRKAAIEEEGGLNLNVNVLRKTRGWIFWPKGHDPAVWVDVRRSVGRFLRFSASSPCVAVQERVNQLEHEETLDSKQNKSHIANDTSQRISDVFRWS